MKTCLTCASSRGGRNAAMLGAIALIILPNWREKLVSARGQ
jgi:hypothetical protein